MSVEAIEDWAYRCLGEGTAPLLAQLCLAWAQRGSASPEEQERWRNVAIACEESQLEVRQAPEVAALGERELSRFSDVALGEGPVVISLQPQTDDAASLRISSAGSTNFLSNLGGKDRPYTTFGSSRDESPCDPKAVSLNDQRFPLPGPGTYTPKLDGRQYKLDTGGFVHGVTFQKEEREKHLARSIRPKGQYHALPLRCGPAPGFYSIAKFPCPKERAAPNDRCQAKLFRPASELPAGLPPERNRKKVLEVRALNALGNEGPSPDAYNTLEAAAHYSEFPTRVVGRWDTATLASAPLKKVGSAPALSPYATSQQRNEVGKGFFTDKAQGSPSRVRPGYMPGGSGAAASPRKSAREKAMAATEGIEDIREQSNQIIKAAHNRRLDMRNRAVVEDELDRVRQTHKLLAAGGGRRTIKGKDSGAAGAGGSVGSALRERLDGSLQRVSDLFKGFDSSWDGLVSLDEFGMALKALELFTTQEELEQLFKEIDVDDSGEIDFKELKRHLQGPTEGQGAMAVGAVPIDLGGCSSSLRYERTQEWPMKGGTMASRWPLAPGRDYKGGLGEEPPERRSLGPATYDPRMSMAATRPATMVGGDQSKFRRDAGDLFIIQTGIMRGEYALRGVPDDRKKPKDHGSPPRSPKGAESPDASPPKERVANTNKILKKKYDGKAHWKKGEREGNQAVSVLQSKQGKFLKPA